MAKFVKLVNERGENNYINFDLVFNISEETDDHYRVMTCIWFENEQIFVQESPEEILKLMEGK